MEQTKTRSFAASILPWLAAGAVLLVYLFTLNKGVTLTSVGPLARINGMDWHPTYLSPVTWLAALPMRWLPAGLQLFGLNLLGAAIAALTLALLARSVALWPHDRTHAQRIREKSKNSVLSLPTAWVPPLFAALILGFQRTFWENAIIFTGEMVDVFLLAYIIRSLLEYRVEDRDSWLWKAALAYGLGVTNSFAFIAYFPALLVVMVWIKGLRFFEFSFLLRATTLVLAGLALYLVLPAVQSMNEAADVSFWGALKFNLGYQKSVLLNYPRWKAIWLGGYPLVLLLVAGIKWSSGFGDTSRIGSNFGTIITHLVHGALLAFVVYIVFDPPGSPRTFGMGLSYLSSYFLTALAGGYFAGYLLLVFSAFSTRSRRWGAVVMVPMSYVVTAVVCTAAIAVPAKLALDNWPRLRAMNAPEFRNYTARLATSLPKQPCVVLSDDQYRLHCVAMQLENHRDYIFIDTRALNEPAYHRVLRKRHGSIIPVLQDKSPTVPAALNVQLLSALKQKYELYYLHPSFGYFHETFHPQPHQLVYRMEYYPTNAIEAPAASPEAIAREAAFWNSLTGPVLTPLAARVAALNKEGKALQADLQYAARCYSHTLNFWGVELQRAGNFDEATSFFDQAVALNPANSSAFINREANVEWRKTHKKLERLSDHASAKLKEERGVEGLLNSGGPVDEPSFRNELGSLFAQYGLWRQSIQHLYRALSYSPGDVPAQITLANAFLGWGKPDRALALITELRANTPSSTLAPATQMDMLRTEAGAHLDKGDFKTAERILLTGERQFPEQDAVYFTLAQLYVVQAEKSRQAGDAPGTGRMMTNALQVAERHIQYLPQSPTGWFNHGNLLMQLGAPERAIVSYTKVLQGDPKNSSALMNRAIAHLQLKQFDAAQRDYEAMLGFTTTSFRVYYGLGEIAYQKKNWAAARDYYTKYLHLAPAGSAEAATIRPRLAEAKKKG